MARYAIDAATLVQLAAGEIAWNGRHQLVAPNSIRSHAMTLLLQAVQRDEMDEAAALRLHERMTETKMRLLGDRVSRRTAWGLARQHGWPTTYDAEYLAVAVLQADALVAASPDLARMAAGVVQLADVEALSRD